MTMASDHAATQCRVAFVGAGFMTREHAKAFAAVPGVELAGLYSRGREQALQAADALGIARVCDSVADLYEKCRPDLVVVSVPELEMNGVALACLAHPWSILLEKPAGYDVADAQSIIDAAGVRASAVMVGLNRRWYGATRAALADLVGIPGPRYVRVQDQQDQAAALLAGQPAKVVANWMYANSIHVIDYFSLFARGKVVSVEPVVRWVPSQPGVVVSKLMFSSGDVGLYEGVWNGPGPWAVTISTPQKRWELRPLEQAAFQEAGSRRLVPIDADPRDTAYKAGLHVQATHAVAAAMAGPRVLPSLCDAMRSMQIVERIFA